MEKALGFEEIPVASNPGVGFPARGPVVRSQRQQPALPDCGFQIVESDNLKCGIKILKSAVRSEAA